MTLNLRNEEYDTSSPGLGYIVAEGGIIKLPEHLFIPENSGFLWRQYEAWLALPNVPSEPFTLSQLKEQKKEQLLAEFEKQIQRNITVAGTLLRADYNSVIRYMQLIDYDGAIPVKPSPIILPDYSTVTKTKAELTAINSAITVRQNNSYANYNTKLSAINAAVDEATLDAIDLTTGWPA